MKEYRELRQKVSFLQLCKSPELVCEATLTAVNKINPDAAIIFSDILLILEPLGFDLDYVEGKGPVISNPFSGSSDLERMEEIVQHPHDPLPFVKDAISLTKRELNQRMPVIGFSGAPFTVAAYAIEGGSSKDFSRTRSFMQERTEEWNTFLSHITTLTASYLNSQVQGGAQALQIFDSWVGLLSREEYSQYVLPHTKRLIASLPSEVPIIHFGTKTKELLNLIATEIGASVVGIDSDVSVRQAMEDFPNVAIQGNFDPQILLTTPKEIEKEAMRILNEAEGRPGHIFNLAHGVLPSTPVDHVIRLIDFVHEKSHR